jgi:hypothetical protein
VVEACGDTLPMVEWAVWQEHLLHRDRPRRPTFLSGSEPPLLWGLRSSEFGFRIADLTPENATKPNALFDVHGSLESAIGVLGRAYSLPEMSQRVPSDEWWTAVAELHDIAVRAESRSSNLDSAPESLVVQQLLTGELPIALSYLFPEVRALRELRGLGRIALSEALVEWTDGEGLPHGRLMHVLGPLWACWTRARWMGSRFKRGPWSREAEVQYQWLVRHAIRLTGPDGGLSLADTTDDSDLCTESDWSRGLYRTALEMVGDPWDYAAAIRALPTGTFEERIERKVAEHDLPALSLNSEWSGVGVLATGWSRSSARLALNWSDRAMRAELSIGDVHWFSGDWTFRTTCNGEAVSIVGEWEQACWQSDEKCDYLELAIELSHGLRLERQVILSRRDHAIFVADAVLVADGARGRIEHTIELPLATDTIWRPELESRDGVLVSSERQMAVLPLALAEWRSDPRGGRLEVGDGTLRLTQETTGQGLYCPLLFDLKHKRSRKDRTWRQLTVVELLETTRSDVAVGFRAQSGRKQWLIYRSLGPAGNRTVLGQNIAGEFYAGRIKSSGKIDEWIEIEPVEANDDVGAMNDPQVPNDRLIAND